MVWRRRSRQAPQDAAFSFARIEAESSMLRWFMARHGEGVLTRNPGLLARLASQRCAVALIFNGDRVVALVAWAAPEAGQAELLVFYSVDGPARPAVFLYGPDGPLAASRVHLVWLLTDQPGRVKELRADGFAVAPSEHGGRGAARLERGISSV
ncbi:MAG: hypothetical protein LBJ62_03445 [Bifidobacteriaceae bacterium]|jgi:hypothetical protein|nr:hypothetical protein [Bifidobacteriaceae bacterium]